MEGIVQPTLDFIAANAGWAFPVMFITSFAESFIFVSLLFPGTSILVVAGTLMSAGSLPYWPVLAGGDVGAVLGGSVWLWRWHCADLAVHTQYRAVTERHPIFSQARRQECFYRPFLWPGEGGHPARR